MSQNSSDTIVETSVLKKRRSWRIWAVALILTAWVFISFEASGQLIVGLLWLLNVMHVAVSSFNEEVLTTILSALIYLIAIALVIGLPWVVKKYRTTLKDIGLHRLPLWSDILMALVGVIVYFLLSGLLMFLATSLFPSFNPNQAQNTGFGGITQQYQYVLAFITLVIIAPVAEEVLFRGYLFGKLKKLIPVWVAILVTSLLFGVLHGAWNLAIDTFALSIVLCLLRLSTRSIWASILVHMIKNGIAFYILFVNPFVTGTIGG